MDWDPAGRQLDQWRRFAACCSLLIAVAWGTLACGPLAPRPVPPPTVKLGLVAPFSGVHQHAGERVLRAVKLAIAGRNGRGGIAGHPVELVAHDDRSDPVQGASAARRLALDPEIAGVLGHPARSSAESARPIYRDAQLPAVLLGSVSADRPDPEGLIVQLAPSNAAVALAAADFAVQQQARTAAVVAGPLSQDLTQAEALRQAAQRAGLRLLRTEALFPASTDYRDTVARLSSVAPDVLFIAASLPTSAAFWKEAAGAARFAVLVGGVVTAPEDFRAIAGPASRTAYFPSPVPNLSSGAALAAFAARYREHWAAEADPAAALAYDAASLLLEAMDRASRNGAITRAGVRLALQELRTYGGVTGRAVFDPSGPLTYPTVFFASAGAGESPSGSPKAAAASPPSTNRAYAFSEAAGNPFVVSLVEP